jgi:adenine-specific DNA-methyltransferase
MEKHENNNHIIYHGESINILKNEIPTESVDLVFIDPPYNIGKKFSNFHDKWLSDTEYAKSAIPAARKS